MSVQIDLSGEWRFQLDGNKEGIQKEFYRKDLEDHIILPSTTAKEKKGQFNTKREIGYLTEEYPFEGYAWYAQDIDLTEEMLKDRVHKRFVLVMERTRKSSVWIDDQYVGEYLSFCSPHCYDLTPYLSKTKHKLTVMISNVDYPTKGGHMTSPDTQTNWNGILGEISLKIYDAVHIQDVQVYPNIENKQGKAVVKLNYFGKLKEAALALSVSKKNVNKVEGSSEDEVDRVCLADDENGILKFKYDLHQGINEIEVIYEMKDELMLWDEYDKNLYELRLEVFDEKKSYDVKKVTFGFRDFKAGKVNFEINGRKTFLRGKHDGMIFPLTGYAPMNKEEWIRVFKIAKNYGMNHYRFHTCCPPEAAFEAADEIGIYLQPEIPFWGTILAKGAEGYDGVMQDFLIKEGDKILKEFGNHPSFVMMSMGNELWGDKKTIREIVEHYKKLDPRHLYTQGSNNFQFYPTYEPVDDFFSGVRFSKERLIRGSYAMCDAPQGHIQTMEPNTTYNYDEMIRPKVGLGTEAEKGKKMIEVQYGTGVKKVEALDEGEMIPNIPVVSHEVGQYETFPNFKEIYKYTGVLKARNFEVFKERLEEKNMLDQAEDFFMASGKLAAQCYKMEIETALRSKELAGFQLLDLQDFSGQGTALVGVLDAFMEPKGIISEKEWHAFCSEVVLLLEIPRFVFEAGEEVEGNIKLSYYLPAKLSQRCLKVSLLDHEQKTIYEENIHLDKEIIVGLNDIQSIKLKMPEVQIPQKYTIQIELVDSLVSNHYEIWVYPKECPRYKEEDIVVTEKLQVAIDGLKEGKRVLFLPKEHTNAIQGTYCTDFWCYPMFRSISESLDRPVPIGTMGLLIQNKHKALENFSSETYTTPQWWHILEQSTCTVLDGTRIKPIVQMIDNFERNHRLGIVYEIKAGEGKVLVCTANIKESQYIENRWLYSSLMKYILSDAFLPKDEMAIEEFVDIFSISK